MWNLKKVNLFTKQKQTHKKANKTYGYQSGEKIRGLGLTDTLY